MCNMAFSNAEISLSFQLETTRRRSEQRFLEDNWDVLTIAGLLNQPVPASKKRYLVKKDNV